jgi:transcriptional regulator with XRE-family HTH domain
MARRQTQLGDKVAKLREKKRLTQQELAERAGCTQGLISKLEKQVRQNVHSDVLKGLAQTLGCTTDYLVGMHEEEADESAA